jgi:AraC-like DNA-binding protein
MAYDLRSIFDQIHSHLQFTPTISLTQLQVLLGINRHTLLKAVKTQTGQTFRELRSEVLVQYISLSLTEHPCSNLKEISFSTGYKSQRSLSRFVKATVGLSPKQLRTKNIASS